MKILIVDKGIIQIKNKGAVRHGIKPLERNVFKDILTKSCMFITISGTAASGKSTVARLLAQHLNYEYVSMGEMSRKLAAEMGITLEHLNALSEHDAFRDKLIDDYQKKLGMTKSNMVVDGRLSFYFIPQSVKVFIECPIEKRAERIFNAKRSDEQFSNVEEAKIKLEQRELSDKKRYLQYYGINCFDYSHYDLVLDSAQSTPENLLIQILSFLDEPRNTK